MENEVVLFNTGVTPEDVLKRSHNGMAPRKEYELIPWKEDSEIYDPAELEKIEIVNEAPSIPVGGTQRLYVKQTPEIANLPELCWESSNLEVAWVNQEGIVYGLADGEAIITVSKPNSDFSDMVTVTVGEGSEANEEVEPEP